MPPVLQTLNETSAAVNHLEDHLQLLLELLRRLDTGLMIDLAGLGTLIERVGARPVVGVCGVLPPEQPALNACDGLIIPRDATSVSIGNLAAVVERTLHWCEAIRRALGDPIGPPEDLTS